MIMLTWLSGLLRLAERANTKVKGVYKFDMSKRTKAANAALTGIGNTRRIVLGDTLINEFTPDEIETVLAHELGHHVHKDIPISIAFGTVMTLVGLYLASLAMNWAVGYFGFLSVADPAAMPMLELVLGAYGLVIMPLENAVSRWRERMADAVCAPDNRESRGVQFCIYTAWRTRTWVKWIPNDGWWSCSIPTHLWVSALPWLRLEGLIHAICDLRCRRSWWLFWRAVGSGWS